MDAINPQISAPIINDSDYAAFYPVIKGKIVCKR